MKLTGAAILVTRGMKALQAAPAAYPYRWLTVRPKSRSAIMTANLIADGARIVA